MIERVINSYSQDITLRALRRQFEAALVHGTAQIYGRRPGKACIAASPDEKTADREIQNALRILDYDENKLKLTDRHIQVITDLLSDIDLLDSLPEESIHYKSSGNRSGYISETSRMPVISHPGMYHANISYSLRTLQSSRSWLTEISEEERTAFPDVAYSYAAGFIMENFLLADADQKAGTE